MTRVEMKMSGEQFTEIITSLSAVVHETRITANHKGLFVCSVDTAHVVMVELNLAKSYFEKYVYDNSDEGNADETKPFVFGIDLYLHKSVLPVKKTDLIEWVYEAQGDGLSQITINGRRVYTFKSDDVTSFRKSPTVKCDDVVTLKNVVEIEAKALNDFVVSACKISDKTGFSFNATAGVLLKSKGDKGEVSETLDYDSVVSLETKHSLVSLDYLKEITRAMKGYRKILLRFDEDHPVCLTKEFLGQDAGSYLTFLLAPRIEAD